MSVNVCHIGDCREILPTLPKAQMCVTSPPYWGLRDYGTATWNGGDPGCDHQSPNGQGETGQRADRAFTANQPYKEICARCGACRIDQQLGLESTPEEYVQNMVEVFRLVRNVLADDGTLWLNMGDSYAGSGLSGASYQSKTTKRRARPENKAEMNFRISKTLTERGLTYADKKPIPPPGLKSKDLVGIPWRLAFALQADGWWLRSDIIWSKPNPMPESVTDRPTKSHEYLFLLSKQAQYYYDADAIREPPTGRTDPMQFGTRAQAMGREPSGNEKKGASYQLNGKIGRNIRSVWTIATQPYSEAHFATFPEALVEPCILAGSRSGDVVLDPFFGSGTVGEVAERLGRQWIGIELNPDYAKLAKHRTAQQGLELRIV